jgi:hypothetical protein
VRGGPRPHGRVSRGGTAAADAHADRHSADTDGVAANADTPAVHADARAGDIYANARGHLDARTGDGHAASRHCDTHTRIEHAHSGAVDADSGHHAASRRDRDAARVACREPASRRDAGGAATRHGQPGRTAVWLDRHAAAVGSAGDPDAIGHGHSDSDTVRDSDPDANPSTHLDGGADGNGHSDAAGRRRVERGRGRDSDAE